MKIVKKLRARHGLSVVEMLAAVLALALLCLALGSGLHLAVHSYRVMTAEAETQLLLSTAADALMDELRFADPWAELAADGQLVTYESQRYGPYASIAIDADGHLVVKNPTAPDEGHPLLASGVYGANGVYKLSLPDGIVYDRNTYLFTFTLRAEQDGLASAEQRFTVRCLNGGYEL